MSKNKTQHIYCELFRMNFYVCYGVPRREFEKIIKEFDTEMTIPDSAEGRCFRMYFTGDNDFKGAIIWIWTENKSISILAHECFHAAKMALKINHIEKTEELIAYYLQYLMKKILEANHSGNVKPKK